MDPHGYAVPLGAHIRRMNPRDTASNMSRRRMIRRGGTYGPPLPEGAPDDGVERGIAAFIGCASLVRQFEFAQNVWVNDQVLPRASERTRSHHRHSGRHARIQDPEPAGSQTHRRAALIHHRERRRVLLPSRHKGAAVPGGFRFSVRRKTRRLPWPKQKSTYRRRRR